MAKSCGVHGARLTAAIASLNIGWVLMYQAAEWGRTEPDLTWRIPAPIETSVTVNLRRRTTSAGLQDVGIEDGLRIMV
jgi:hypothetical protein